MDTLLIVRKIREAEALADSGKHGEAKRMLQPLLNDGALTDSHRKLVTKKIELFDKQQERMTRIISRRGTGVRGRDPADESSAKTVIRKAKQEDASERPTNKTVEPESRGAPTEVVPRARDVDTEVPEQGHRLKTTPAVESDSAGMFPRVPERREIKRPVDPSDSQELAPVSDDDSIHQDDVDDDDPRATDIFVSPGEKPTVRDSVVKLPVDDDSAPSISRANVDKPVFDSGNDTPPPTWRDTPVPKSETDSGRTPEVQVRDSIVVAPRADSVPDLNGGGRDSDDSSTYLLADEYFKSVSSRRRERSNPELKALAERLPDDDLRRELALEVVRLRERLDKVEQESARREEVDVKKATRAGSRKITREERPESGSFHIPSSQVNTIVRRAAGTDRIEVHMPDRDDDAADLQVLRRDSVRGRKAQPEPTDRIALAQDYIDASSIKKPSLLKPLATWLGVAVMIAVVAWGVHLGYSSLTHAESDSTLLTEKGVGEFQIGELTSTYQTLTGTDDVLRNELQGDVTGWIFQYDDTKRITSITIPGPEFSGEAKLKFNELTIVWEGNTLRLRDGAGRDKVLDTFGAPIPEFSEKIWSTESEYTLRFETQPGDRALELHYKTAEPETPVWIRISDAGARREPPDLDDYREVE